MKNKSSDEEHDKGNRGIIEVRGKSSPKKIFILIAILICTLFVIIILYKFLSRPEAVKQTGLEKTNETLVTGTNNNIPLTSIMRNIEEKEKIDEANRKKAEVPPKTTQPHSPPSETTPKPEESAASSIARNNPPSSTGGHGEQNPPLPKSLRQLMGETMVNIDSADNNAGSTGGKDDLQGGEYADGTVTPVLNRRYLLSAGTSLSCVLKTKIVTTYPGITLCQLTRNVWSDNGEVLLARKGSTLIGEQNKVMTQGATRVFVNWTTLKNGKVNVRIGALGTDSLGASGLPAWVDNHFGQRFGGALLLSLLGDGLDILKNSTQQTGSNSNITYENTSDATQEMAKTTLDNTINIPPTAYINQGTVLSVIVPRNIDFSSVYELH